MLSAWGVGGPIVSSAAGICQRFRRSAAFTVLYFISLI